MNHEFRLEPEQSGHADVRVCQCVTACVHLQVGDFRLKFSADQFLAFADSLMEDYARLTVKKMLDDRRNADVSGLARAVAS
jgi:hypothetical protein